MGPSQRGVVERSGTETSLGRSHPIEKEHLPPPEGKGSSPDTAQLPQLSQVEMLLSILGSIMLGVCIVFARRSPYFGIFGVLLQAVAFSVLLCLLGLPFLGLLTILIYVGGMLIIFLFSTILRAERYPDSG